MGKLKMALIKEIEAADAEMKELKRELINRILALPDNPDIQRLDKNCFIAKMSKIKDNWAVEYSDFLQQYKLIAKEIEKKEPLSAVRFLEQIIIDGKFRIESQNYTVRLHPKVIEHLKDTCAVFRGIRVCMLDLDFTSIMKS